MPIYEYLCASCGYQFEEVQKFNEPPLEECPDCGKNSARRQVSMSAFHLKGGAGIRTGIQAKAMNLKKQKKPGKKKQTTQTRKHQPRKNSLLLKNQVRLQTKKQFPARNLILRAKKKPPEISRCELQKFHLSLCKYFSGKLLFWSGKIY